MRKGYVLLIGLIFAVPMTVFGIRDNGEAQPEVVISFDASQGELPEGITLDKPGNMYVSLGPPFFVGGGYGAVWKVGPKGTETTVLAEYPNGPAPAGLVGDASGNLYFALPDPGGADGGVYRLSGGGNPERLPGTENIVVPNGLALDKHGDLFVSDSVLGAIWRIQKDKFAAAEIWFQHELIAGCTPEDFGANGVAFWRGDMYVANTGRGALVHIPILPDGSPGDPSIVAGNLDCEPEGLFGMDGIALDVHGNVYALLVLQNKLVRIDPTDGSFSTLLTGEDGLWNPASIVFGTGRGDRESIFITNYAVIPPGSDIFGPAVLKYYVGVPGLPLP